jgi:hypothetical protein
MEKADIKNKIKTDELWKESRLSPLIIEMKKGVSFQAIISKHGLKKTLRRIDHTECCDGRCPHMGDELSIAGSGIILPDEDFDVLIKSHPEVRCLTSHYDCGASKTAFEKRKETDNLPDSIFTPEQFAKWWTRGKAEEYGLEYRHISEDDFKYQFRRETGISLDTTGNFHPSIINNMPNVFISDSAGSLPEGYVMKELAVLASIAFGNQGFGNRFTNENPFYIFICAKDDEENLRLSTAAQKALSDYGSRIDIQGFCLPTNHCKTRF